MDRSDRVPVADPFRLFTLVLLAFVTACSNGEDPRARVGLIVPAGAQGVSVRRGAELGAAEAARAGELIGTSFELLTVQASTPADLTHAAERLRERGAFALVGGFDEDACRSLAEFAERERIVFLNVGCRSDAARHTRRARTFHIEASDSMYRSHAAQEAGDPVLWHADLVRYGAAQLNERFLRQTGAPADPAGWAGWLAVKVLWESLVRTNSTDAEELARFLRSEEAGFDGHKGEPLRFDSATHQLRQPLYPSEQGSPTRADDPGPDDGAPIVADPLRLEGGEYAYVSNEGSHDVSVIDLASQREIARIEMSARPRGIHASPDGARVYVALSDDAPTAASDRDAIAEIDLREGRVIASYPAGTDPEQFALSPDGTHLYAANEDAGTASITKLDSGEVLVTLVVGIEPEGVAVSPDGRWAYVTAETSNTVSAIDTERAEVVASFLVDVRPRAVAFSPVAPRAFVTNEISGTVSVVDTETHTVIATIPLAEGRAKPVGVAVSPDGTRVYVANGHGDSLSAIDATTHRVIATIPVGKRPWGIAVSADGTRIYTANGASDDLSVIDARTLQVLHTLPAGERPWGVAIVRR